MSGEEEQSSWWLAPFSYFSETVEYYTPKLHAAAKALPGAVVETYKAVTKAGSAAKEALQSSISANIVGFAIPVLTARYAAPVATAFLQQFTEEDSLAEASVEPIVNASVLLLTTRLTLRMLATNTAITLGGTMKLNKEAADEEFTQVHEHDGPSSAESQAALVIHYLATTATLAALQSALSWASPTIGGSASFFFSAYWQGVVYLLYVLDRHEVDAEKQIAIANTDVSRCLLLGACIETGSRLPQLILGGALPEWSTALSNIALMLAPVLAQKMDFDVPAEVAPSTKLDPILLTWNASFFVIQATQKPLKKFLKGLTKGGSKSPATQAIANAAKFIGGRVYNSTATKLLVMVTVPTELTSIERFINYGPVKPFAAPAHQRVTEILEGIITIAEHPGFKAVEFSLRIPFVGKLLTKGGAAYCKHRLGVPSDLVKLLAKLIKHYDLESLARKVRAHIKAEIKPDVRRLAPASAIQDDYASQAHGSDLGPDAPVVGQIATVELLEDYVPKPPAEGTVVVGAAFEGTLATVNPSFFAGDRSPDSGSTDRAAIPSSPPTDHDASTAPPVAPEDAEYCFVEGPPSTQLRHRT